MYPVSRAQLGIPGSCNTELTFLSWAVKGVPIVSTVLRKCPSNAPIRRRANNLSEKGQRN